MPELPDLQVFASNLQKKIAGKTVKRVNVRNKKKLKTGVPALRKAIEGSQLRKVYREGKELYFQFDNDNVLALHLMLRGGLALFEKKFEGKYPIIEMIFDDDTGLVMTDYQGAATPTLNPEDKEVPDALSKKVNARFLKEQLSRRKTNIKTFLLDQKIIRGIGNAYADEILWEARISPLSTCNKIPDERISALAKAIPRVLKNAEKQIRKINPGIISGEERSFLAIHNSKKKKSPNGKAIKHVDVNGRVTYFTAEQRLYK